MDNKESRNENIGIGRVNGPKYSQDNDWRVNNIEEKIKEIRLIPVKDINDKKYNRPDTRKDSHSCCLLSDGCHFPENKMPDKVDLEINLLFYHLYNPILIVSLFEISLGTPPYPWSFEGEGEFVHIR